MKDGFGDLKSQVNQMLDDNEDGFPVKGKPWRCKCGNQVGAKFNYCPVCGTSREEMVTHFLDEQAKKEYKDALDNVALLEEERKKLLSTIQTKNKNIVDFQNKTTELLRKLSDAEEESKRLASDISGKEKELDATKRELDERKHKVIELEDELKDKVNKLDNENKKIVDLKNSLGDSKNKILELENKLNDINEKNNSNNIKDDSNGINEQNKDASQNNSIIDDIENYVSTPIEDVLYDTLKKLYPNEAISDSEDKKGINSTILDKFRLDAVNSSKDYKQYLEDDELNNGINLSKSSSESDNKKALNCFIASVKTKKNPEAIARIGEMHEYQYETIEDFSDDKLLYCYIKAAFMGSGRGSFKAYNIYAQNIIDARCNGNKEKADEYMTLAKFFIDLAVKQDNYEDNLGVISDYKKTGKIYAEQIDK